MCKYIFLREYFQKAFTKNLCYKAMEFLFANIHFTNPYMILVFIFFRKHMPYGRFFVAAKNPLYESQYGLYEMKPNISQNHKNKKKNQDAA